MDAIDRKPECRVFVGNLDYHTTSQDLVDAIETAGIGIVVDVFFPKDRKRNPPKLTKRKRGKREPVNYGCAFIQLQSKEQAAAILVYKGEVKDAYDRVLYFCESKVN